MEFKWLNEGEIVKKDNRIEVKAPAQTDFFCGSIDECEEGIPTTLTGVILREIQPGCKFAEWVIILHSITLWMGKTSI